ncbi:MAG: leucyl/phenylalanyl-tRNA--protein transferase [Alphaproteobacteria bacterium]|nr:leucyl/phenylalanyl-tRNA--protein transferase [Alphaproteobacteria bacterium]
MTDVITPHDLLRAYSIGLFPMADGADDPDFYWIDPPLRGQLSIDHLHIPHRLRRTIRQAPFTITTDTAFAAVIDHCAAARPQRPSTWINRPIRDLFVALHHQGYAHSVECWRGTELIGGIYGLALGSAFFGESMFSTTRDASKVALVHLTARLWHGGFTLFDTQFVNPHLEQFGVYEIPQDEYKARLHTALTKPAAFGGILDESALSATYLAHNQASK